MTHRLRAFDRLAGAAVITSVMALGMAQAQAAETYHERVAGIAEVLTSTCPWGIPPADGAVCTDTAVRYYLATLPGEPAARAEWTLEIAEETSRYNEATDDFTLLHQRHGQVLSPEGYVDTARLRQAWVRGSVPMDDGSSIDVDMRIEQPGPLYVDGTDGPSYGPVPWGSHLHDACLTENWLAHQVYRWDGTFAGTISSVDPSSMHIAPHEPYIGRGVITVTHADHASCTP